MNFKNVGIIGSGAVGRALGTGLVNLGYRVMIGSRQPDAEKLVAWKTAAGANASTGSLSDTAAFGEILIVATKWSGTENALTLSGPEHFNGKVVIDTTNPIGGPPPTPEGLISFTIGTTDSAAENIQRWLPGAHVVKAFNIIGNHDMVNPSFAEGDADMYICGNDDAAKATVTALLKELGWKSVLDFGKIEAARAIEPLCVLWCIYGFRTGTWHHAVKIIR
jgi:predicted dinucleotide-binding enzyme